MFDRIRARGARVVQINHPRMSNAYFDRLNIVYDFASGTISQGPRSTYDPEIAHMDPNEPLFSPNFDALEIFNATRGHHEAMRDWFSLLSMGLTPTGTGVSDTHAAFSKSTGEPRTYVAVSADRPSPIDTDDLLDNLLAGRAFISNGPVLRVTVVDGNDGMNTGSYGDTLSASGSVTVEVEVQTPEWFTVDEAQLFLTQTYGDPPADARQAVAETGSAEPPSDLTISLTGQTVSRANGGTGQIFTGSFTLDTVTLGESDGWIVVRVFGPAGTLYPVVLTSGGATVNVDGTTPETFAQFGSGYRPFAMGNPIFIDRDGNGVYDAPFPLSTP